MTKLAWIECSDVLFSSYGCCCSGNWYVSHIQYDLSFVLNQYDLFVFGLTISNLGYVL
jgi:hypothetical protein